MDDLVARLSQGDHKVEVRVRPETTVAGFKECLDRGLVHIRFPETRGGTELGVRLDQTLTDLNNADFQTGKGIAHLSGVLTLNSVKVQCIGRIDLETLSGVGQLIPASEAVPAQPN